MLLNPNLRTDIVINLTDWKTGDILPCLKRQKECFENARLAIGSYLCGNYFRKLCCTFNIAELPVSYDLVIPIIAQHDLTILEDTRTQTMIRQACHIVVNDPGMLMRFGGDMDVRLGRLFFRTYRDHRYPAYEGSMVKREKMLALIKALREIGCKFNAVECEIIGEVSELKPDEGEVYYYHCPLRLISAMRICEYASFGKPVTQKFLPDDQCQFQCIQSCVKYSDNKFQNEYLKWGRGLYDRVSVPSFEGLNLIVMPDAFEEIPDENYGTAVL